MTYTRPWSNALPSGRRTAPEFDDAMRELRVDLAERMGTLLTNIGNWSNDPIAGVLTRRQTMHWSAFRHWDARGAIMGGNVYIAANAKSYVNALYNHGIGVIDSGGAAVTANFFARILLPTPCTLVDADILGVVASAGASIALSIIHVDTTNPAVPVETVLATRTLSNPTTQGIYSVSSGVNINTVISNSDTEYVFAKLALTSDTSVVPVNFGFQGMRLTYTRTPLLYV